MEPINLIQFCESKIEEGLLRAIEEAFRDCDTPGLELGGLPPAEYSSMMDLRSSGASIHLMPQAIIEGSDGTDWRYRVDFLMICGVRRGYRRCFAIECDGHDWHEKTKQQVARDKLRDRRLIVHGIVPIRFSGSEIHRKPKQCADFVLDLANATLGDVLYQAFNADEAAKAQKARKRRRKA